MHYSFFALVFVCLTALQSNGRALEKYAPLREKCYKELGLTKRQIITSESGLEFLKNPKSPCYLKCFFEGNRLFRPDSSLDQEEALRNIDPEIRDQARPLVYKCAAENDHVVGRCEKAYASTKCMGELSPTIMLQLGVLEVAQKA